MLESRELELEFRERNREREDDDGLHKSPSLHDPLRLGRRSGGKNEEERERCRIQVLEHRRTLKAL